MASSGSRSVPVMGSSGEAGTQAPGQRQPVPADTRGRRDALPEMHVTSVRPQHLKQRLAGAVLLSTAFVVGQPVDGCFCVTHQAPTLVQKLASCTFSAVVHLGQVLP